MLAAIPCAPRLKNRSESETHDPPTPEDFVRIVVAVSINGEIYCSFDIILKFTLGPLE
jgi:hypothetical protein